MERHMPDIVMWALVLISLSWAIFTIVVMVVVLRLANEAIPFFRRQNAEYLRGQAAPDKAAHQWAYE
jgi:hypothetical protein